MLYSSSLTSDKLLLLRSYCRPDTLLPTLANSDRNHSSKEPPDIQPQEMIVSRPSNDSTCTEKSGDTTLFYDPVGLSTELREADVCKAQHPVKTYLNAKPTDKDAKHVLRYNCPAASRSDQSTLACSEPTSDLPGSFPGDPKEERDLPCESTCSPSDNRKDCGPGRPVWKRKTNIQEGMVPQHHSTHDGTRSVCVSRRPKNVIIFGETGVGKSSVINLIAGDKVADTSPDLQGCTLDATDYWFSLSKEVALHIFDTVGLEEPDMSVTSFMGAIENAHQLVRSLHTSGGIDLLLFCIRGGRLTIAAQRTYRLFFEILCGSQVPLAIVVTNLEQENVMEDWWVKNEKTLNQYGIRPVAHACITAAPGHVALYAQKRAESREALRNMLLDTLTNPRPSYVRDIRSWFTAILQQLRSFLVKNESLKRRRLVKKLEKRCTLPHGEAERLAQMLIGG